MAEEITLPSAYVESKDFSDTLKLSYVMIDGKAKLAKIIFETHNGADWTGRFVEVDVDATTISVKKLNGDIEVIPGVNFDTPGFRSLFDRDSLVTFLNNKVSDYKQGT